MKRIIQIIFITFFLSHVYAQSDYKIDTFTIKYDTLTDYNSLAYESFLEGQLPLYFDHEFDLGFEMPYWDTLIRKINIDNEQIVLLEGSIDFNMMLLAGEWSIYLPKKLNSDTTFYSDYRYKNGMIDGEKYFVLEYRHVSHNNFWYDKTQGERGDFNFQSWLWKNGDIEIRFGKMQTKDTTVFKDNFGLITEYDGQGYWNAGLIGIDNYNGTKGIYYGGNYDNPKIFNSALLLSNDIQPITTLPHEGFVIRFKKQTSSTSEIKDRKPFPNVVSDMMSIPSDFNYSEYRIYDLSGRELIKGTDRDIDVSLLQNGYYAIKLKDGAGVYTYKFLKQ